MKVSYPTTFLKALRVTESTESPPFVGPTVRLSPYESSIGTETSCYPAELTLFSTKVYYFGTSAFAFGAASLILGDSWWWLCFPCEWWWCLCSVCYYTKLYH